MSQHLPITTLLGGFSSLSIGHGLATYLQKGTKRVGHDLMGHHSLYKYLPIFDSGDNIKRLLCLLFNRAGELRMPYSICKFQMTQATL